MGKFSIPKVREYDFATLEKMVDDICEEFEEGSDIEVIVSADEAQAYITAIMTTGKFRPNIIEFDLPMVNGYEGEYTISLIHIDDGELFVEKTWNEKSCKYIVDDSDFIDVTFVSQNVSKTLFDQIADTKTNVILFDIKN